MKLFKEAPKVELHTHLDGALQPATLCRLAIENDAVRLLNTTFLSKPPPVGCRLGVKASAKRGSARQIDPDATACPPELAPYVTSFETKSLSAFLEPFTCISDFILLPGGVEALGGTFVPQQISENTVYTEAQFAPQLLLRSCNPFVDCDARSPAVKAEVRDVVKRVIDGVVSAERRNATVLILLDCMRNLNVSFCEQVLDLAVEMKGSADTGVSDNGTRFKYADYIVGVNLAGDEMGFPNSANPGGAESYEALFARKKSVLRSAGLGFAPHSGEPKFAQSAEDCAVATDRMGALRVGHGYHCTQAHMAEMASDGLHIEVCPASSMATGAVGSWEGHPILTMQKLGVSMSLNTDDRAVIGTTMTEQHELAFFKLGFSLQQLVAAAIDGNRASFATAGTKARVCRLVKDWWARKLEGEGGGWLSEVATASDLVELHEYVVSIEC